MQAHDETRFRRPHNATPPRGRHNRRWALVAGAIAAALVVAARRIRARRNTTWPASALSASASTDASSIGASPNAAEQLQRTHALGAWEGTAHTAAPGDEDARLAGASEVIAPGLPDFFRGA